MTSRKINYKDHVIEFHNLLTKGHNIDKFILNNTLFQRPDHNFNSLVKLLKKDSIVYDIGSYIGSFAIPMAIEGLNIYTFEGFPDNFERCKKNCKPYKNIKNYLCALSDKTYSVKSGFNSCMDGDYSEQRDIKYFRFDDFVKINSLPDPDLVKMDIEGMETIALLGMDNILENVRPIWSLGYHYKFYSTVDGYPGWLDVKDGGFDFYKFDQLGYRLYDERGKRVPYSTLDNRGGEFVLIPEEKIKK